MRCATRKCLCLIALALSALIWSAPAAARSGAIRFGFVPSEDLTRIADKFYPLLDHLTEKIGVEFEPVFFREYAELQEAFDGGAVDIAWMGPLMFAEAYWQGKAVPIAAVERRGKDMYRGEIVTREDSEINSLADLRGREVGFVDLLSASGYLMPRLMLEDAGLKWKKDFSPRFLGKHDNVLLFVLFGRIDAGAVFERAEWSYLDESQRRKLKVIAVTDPVPSDVIVARQGVMQAVVDRMREELLSLRIKAFPEILEYFSGFADVKLERYRALESYLESLSQKQVESAAGQ